MRPLKDLWDAGEVQQIQTSLLVPLGTRNTWETHTCRQNTQTYFQRSCLWILGIIRFSVVLFTHSLKRIIITSWLVPGVTSYNNMNWLGILGSARLSAEEEKEEIISSFGAGYPMNENNFFHLGLSFDCKKNHIFLQWIKLEGHIWALT